MKITAKLALSQLKINRSRTLWALAATSLSTSLTTAVCSFVASGNAMLVGLLGPDYGEYGASYVGMLLIPAILFGIIILSLSVIVVSNVFRISAGERVAQFGILKCVGATKNQITETVMYESVFLSLVGIPLGILLGLGIAFVGTRVANIFLEELSSLTQLMINQFELSLEFVFSWKAVFLSALICFLTILYSAWRPAKKAAKASAADSVRGEGSVKLEDFKTFVKNGRYGIFSLDKWTQRFFGFEGTLAARNIRRNRRNFKATVIALSIGVILFISLGAVSDQAKGIEAYMKSDVTETVISDYTSARYRELNETTGRKESIYMAPIDSSLAEKVGEKLSAYDGKPVFGMGMDMETYYAVIPQKYFSHEMLSALTSQGYDTKEMEVEIITLDQTHYSALCKKAGVPVGSALLVNEYRYNDNGTQVEIAPYLPDMHSVTLMRADGSSREVDFQGVLTKEDLPAELFYPNISPCRLILPQAVIRGYSWYSDPENIDDFIAYANGVMEEFFPEEENASYMESGFSTRVYQIDDYSKVLNIAIVLALIFLYSFVVLLLLIGFTNVVSTLSTNVLMRKREFAVLQSVGMTPEGLQRMLSLESILCSLKSLVFGIPVGVLMTYLINKPIRGMFPVPYKLPWVSVLLCTLAVFLVTGIITRLALHKLKRQNIIEAIRMEQ